MRLMVNFFLILSFYLSGLPLVHASAVKCLGIYGMDVGRYLIPKPALPNQDVEVVNTVGDLTLGFIHEYRNLSPTVKSQYPSWASFEMNLARVAQAPKWFGLFGITSNAADHLNLSDLVYISHQIESLKQKGFIYAPSLRPETYPGDGPISALAAVQFMAEGKFVVSTRSPRWWRHDLFDHAFTGYMVLPKSITDRFVVYAQLLISLHNNIKITGAARQMISGEIESFAGQFDELTQNISKGLRDRDQSYIFSTLSMFLPKLAPTASSFLAPFKRDFNSDDLSGLEKLNRPYSNQHIVEAYHHILNSFMGNWHL